MWLYQAPSDCNLKESDTAEVEVAIVMRTKDRPLLLMRACASVLEQKFSNWILIIVNDGGEPEAVEQVVKPLRRAFKNRLRVIHNPNSLGMEAASNVGIRASQSRYLIIHDDDDSWHPHFLLETTSFLNHPTHQFFAGVVTQSMRVLEEITSEGVTLHRKEPFNSHLKFVSLSQMLIQNHFPPISFLFRRSIIDEVGLFNEALPVLGDWEFHLRVLFRADIGVIPRPLAYYHHRIQAKNAYGNSVISGVSTHEQYRHLIRNQLLRNAIRERPEFVALLMSHEPPHHPPAPLPPTVHQPQLDLIFKWAEKATRPLRFFWRFLKPVYQVGKIIGRS